MATQLFFRTAVADVHLGHNNARLDGSSAVGWVAKLLSTSRGASLQTDATATVDGATSGVEVAPGNIAQEWITLPVSADVSISGTITANLWSHESSMNANAAINFIVEVIRATDNSLVTIVQSARVTELGTATAAANFTATPGASVTVNRGDRIRVRVYADDAGTMASGFTFSFGYNGATGGASGDSYISFTETFSFESAPSGSQLFLTNAHSGLSGAPALVSNFTGSDESPLSEGGNWAALDSGVSALQRISNAAASSVVSTGASYWTPADFGPDLEAYVTWATANSTLDIVARVQGAGGAGTWDGYRVAATGGTTTTTISVITNGTPTQLISGAASSAWASGDKLGIRIIGSTIQAWRQASGSSDWNLVCTAVDTTYSAAGKVGLGMGHSNDRADDFYASTGSNLFTQKAWTSRGASAVSHHIDSDPSGFASPNYSTDWYTPQLQAFTLAGMAQANLRLGSNDVSNGISAKLEIARVDSDGSNPTVWGSWCLEAVVNAGNDPGGLSTSEAAYNCYPSGDDLSVSAGQRLRIRLYLDDSGRTGRAPSKALTMWQNGPTAAASGDSYVTFPQTLTESAAAPGPAGSRRPRRAHRYLTLR